MSHQGGGPRNYVHKDFHNQIVEQLKARVAALEAELNKSRGLCEGLTSARDSELRHKADLEETIEMLRLAVTSRGPGQRKKMTIVYTVITK